MAELGLWDGKLTFAQGNCQAIGTAQLLGRLGDAEHEKLSQD